MGGGLRAVLDRAERARLSKLITTEYGTLKTFAAECGFSYDALICWLKIDGKKRQPPVEAVHKIEEKLGTKVKICGYQSNNSRTEKLPTIRVDENFALIAGLFSAEGDKKSRKRICITNTNPIAIEAVRAFFLKLNPDGNKVREYVYFPSGKLETCTADNTRYYVNKKSAKTCRMIALYDCFMKMAFEDATAELDGTTDENLAGAFLQGVLCGDGCIAFSAERNYYEISIALEEAEARKTRNALKMLGIEFIEKAKEKIKIITIHKKRNFEKIFACGGFSLQTDKNEKLKNAIANYTYSR